MLRCCGVTIRTLAVLGFLLAMPLLAIPAVANRVESTLAGAPGWIAAQLADAGVELPPFAAPRKTAAVDRRESTATNAVQPKSPGAAAVAEKAPSPALPRESIVPDPDFPAAAPGQETATRTRPDAHPVRPSTDGSSENERLAALQQRLRQLGARNFDWEPTADGRYSFRCDVPLADNSVYSKPFEGTGDDAPAAMQRVEAAISAWHRQSAARRVADSEGLP